VAQEGMKELDSKAWRAFHAIGQQLIPHLGRQISHHSGLTPAEYVVLLALHESDSPTLSVNELATRLGWEISRMSHQVTRMHDSGLLNKRRSNLDSRCFDVKLTPLGRNRITRAIPLQSIEINHCFSDILTKSQMKNLIEISEAISEHLMENHPVSQRSSNQKAS
jgi:DNA-binding MarR family transcriptional regulator